MVKLDCLMYNDFVLVGPKTGQNKELRKIFRNKK